MSTGSSKNGLIIILIILLLAITGLYTFQYIKTVQQDEALSKLTIEKQKVMTEKDSIQRDLQKLLVDFTSLKTDNDTLNQQILSQKAEIESYLEKIKGLSKSSRELAYYKQRIREIQTNRDDLLSQIDSLTRANESLKSENAAFQSDIEQKKGENTRLSGMVSKAEKIKGANISVKLLNEKGKAQIKAKRISEIVICITLIENELAKSGIRNIYFRIIDSKGIVIHESDNNLFPYRSEQLGYSTKTDIDYQNAQVQACGSYKNTSKKLAPGAYDIEAYTDGEKIGQTQITLE